MPELKNFIWIFSKEQTAAAEEDGLAGRKLLNMKVAKFSQAAEKLSKDESSTTRGAARSTARSTR